MKQRSTTQKTLKLFWRHAWRYPRYVVTLLAVSVIGEIVSDYLPPLILASVISRLASGHFRPDQIWASFGTSIVAYILIKLASGFGTWRIMNVFTWKLEAKVERDIAQEVFSHLQQQSANFHANHFGGSLVSQTNKLLSSYDRFADTTLDRTIPLIVGVIFACALLASRAPVFVILLLAFSIFYAVSSIYVTRHGRSASAEQAHAESNRTGYLADAITNVMAVKSFAGAHHEQQHFNNTANIVHDKTMAVMRSSEKELTYLNFLNSSVSSLSLVMAIVGVLVFHSNLATVYLILSYTSTIVSNLFGFSTSTLRNYNRAFGDAADMTEILQIEPEVKDPAEPEAPRIRSGAIAFENVDFTHEGAGEALFHGLNLKVKAGEKVGLVGSSGSGKTTFTRLLLRFSDIDGGEILIDGQNIAHLAQDDLRRHIAYVPQEPIMFHRSLMENIRYGQFDASDEAVFAAAKVAHAHEFIEKLPQGYETLVGERGVKLSGGQRQRVAIARAMLKNAPILVLDEATSALDSESEVLIQDALWKLMEGRTAIVIAHRLSTIQKMDRIVVLAEGQIVEQGSHAELLKLAGTYAKLWAHQSGGFMEE